VGSQILGRFRGKEVELLLYEIKRKKILWRIKHKFPHGQLGSGFAIT
jgi:uncharacterized protein (DUF3820 family)